MTEIKIPRECFKYQTGEQQIASENNKYFEITGISTNESILLRVKGANEYWKVYTDAETLFATNQVKSLFIENARLLTRKQYILGTLYTFFSQKELQIFIDRFNHQAFRVMSPFILKDWHLSVFSRELHYCIFNFLLGLGLTEQSSDRFAEIFVHLIEYDNAYRFRLVDLISELTKEELANPRQAILKLIRIAQDRDGGLSDKYTVIAKVVSFGLYVPKIRRAFNKMIQEATLSN